MNISVLGHRDGRPGGYGVIFSVSSLLFSVAEFLYLIFAIEIQMVRSYRIVTTRHCDRDLSRIDASLRRQATRIINSLKTQPLQGKPLGHRYLREKRLKNYRLYYLVYPELGAVLVMRITTKKAQQTTIDGLRQEMKRYYEHMEEHIKRFPSRF